MKKALLYFPVSLKSSSNGVSKKCLGIIDAFKQKYTVDVFSENEGLVFLNDELLKDFSTTKNYLRFYNYNNAFLSGEFAWVKNKCKSVKYEIAYIRLHWFVSFGLLLFLRKLKKDNPHIIIHIEIPTYPYQEEVKGRFNKARYVLTRLLIPFVSKYVNNIITFSLHKKIWGIPTINLSNGYYNPALEKSSKKIDKRYSHRDVNTFHIAMIAQFSPWHAPDILIESLYKYITNNSLTTKVILHLVGTGKDLGICKEQVENYGIKENVIFYGEKNTDEIVEIITHADVCIGSLGHHRTNIQLSSSLKTREYAFLGMPVILKTPDLDFPDSLYFVKYFPDDDSLLDIALIINFIEKLRISHPNYENEIIQYATDNLTWRKKMEKVFEAYK